MCVCARSTSGGREGGGAGSVRHEDPEDSEGTRQQSFVHGLVQRQEENRQLLTGHRVLICLRLNEL